MIPIKDYNPTTTRAIIVPLLIGINVFVFLFIQPSIGSTSREQIIFTYCNAAIPYEVTHRETLIDAARDGDVRGPGVELLARECPDKSVFASIVRSMFLHGGLLHIAGNMLFLWVFGNNIEDRLGKLKFLIFYLLCGLIATYAFAYVNPDSTVPLVGASGAIAGVLGAYLVLFPRAYVRNLIFFFFITVVDLPAVVVLGLWFVLQIFQGTGSSADVGGVAYMAHVAGFVAGMVLLFVFRPRRPEPTPPVFDPY